MSVQTVFFAQNLPSNVSKNDLLGYWTLNWNAQDASGNNLHGDTLNVEAVEDRFGNKNAALKFNGINSRVEINHDFFNVGMPNYTISLWLKSPQRKQLQRCAKYTQHRASQRHWNKHSRLQ